MSYQDDKRELLKLKQGLIEESETIHEEEKPDYTLHGLKWLQNFIYHNKWYIVTAAFFIAAAVFMIVSLTAKKQGDMRVLVITKDNDTASNVMYKTQQFEEAFERYCPDYDDSGYVHVDVFNIDLSENPDQSYMMAGVTKATGEIAYGEAQLYIVDTPGAKSVSDEELSGFVDLSALFPDCPYINGKLLHIKESSFAYDANYLEACPDDLYMVVREVYPETTNHDRCETAQKKALEVIANIVNGNYAGWIDDQGRIYGLSNDQSL